MPHYLKQTAHSLFLLGPRQARPAPSPVRSPCRGSADARRPSVVLGWRCRSPLCKVAVQVAGGRALCPPLPPLLALLCSCLGACWDSGTTGRSFEAPRLERGLDPSNLTFNGFSSSKWLTYIWGVSPCSSLSAMVFKIQG